MFFLGSPEWHSVQYQDTTPRFNSNLWNYKNRSKLFRNLLSAQSEPKFVYWFLDWFYRQSHKTDRCLQIFKCRHIQIVSGIPFLHVYILNFENFRYIWDLKRNLNLLLRCMCSESFFTFLNLIKCIMYNDMDIKPHWL